MTAPRDMRGGISRVNIYDGHHTTMKVINTIDGHPGRWTITDSHLSPDNEK
jgi:WD repeat-containing protein 23